MIAALCGWLAGVLVMMCVIDATEGLRWSDGWRRNLDLLIIVLFWFITLPIIALRRRFK